MFADVDNSSRIAQEEIFGPVLAVTPFDSDDEAVALANDSRYGLGGSVFTADVARGTDVARRVQTGTTASTATDPTSRRRWAASSRAAWGASTDPRGSRPTCSPSRSTVP